MPRDYYQVLGVSYRATDREIRCAFRKLALEYHPDRNPRDASSDNFKEINEAYQTLINPQERDHYDRERKKRGAASSGWGSLFNSFFGGIGGERGADLEKNITISLKEAYFGAQKQVEVMGAEKCPTCGGTGCKPGTPSEICSHCQGMGRVKQAKRNIFGSFTNLTTCKACQGRGRIATSPCIECKGRGWKRKKRKVQVTIPRGIKSGSKIKLAGEGGIGRVEHGDLHVQVQVEKHPMFQREGDDLVCELPLNFGQAVLGDKLIIPAFEGNLGLDIPSGTQSGDIFTIPGKGMSKANDGSCGDLRVMVKVIIPQDLNQRQKDIIRELKQSLEGF